MAKRRIQDRSVVFLFRPKRDGEEDGSCRVSVQREKNDQYGEPLCELENYSQFSDDKECPWLISSMSPDDVNFGDQLRYNRFRSKEEAANFAYLLRTWWRQTVESQPIPDDAAFYLGRRADTLRNEEQHLLGRLMDVAHEKYQLNQLAKKYGIRHVEWRTDDSDPEKAVRDLLEFKVHVGKRNKRQEVPLFSEAALYELLGKEDARSVLALLKRVCVKVAPNVTEELHL